MVHNGFTKAFQFPAIQTTISTRTPLDNRINGGKKKEFNFLRSAPDLMFFPILFFSSQFSIPIFRAVSGMNKKEAYEKRRQQKNKSDYHTEALDTQATHCERDASDAKHDSFISSTCKLPDILLPCIESNIYNLHSWLFPCTRTMRLTVWWITTENGCEHFETGIRFDAFQKQFI